MTDTTDRELLERADASRSLVEVFVASVPGGFRVWTRYKSDGTPGTEVEVTLDDTWIDFSTNDSEQGFLVHKEALPLLIQALSSLAKEQS